MPELQEGVHYSRGNRAPSFMRNIFIRVEDQTTAAKRQTAIELVWSRLVELKSGTTHHEGFAIPIEKADELSLLIGYGERFFGRLATRPAEVKSMDDLAQFKGGPTKALPWYSPKTSPSNCDADWVIQITAQTQFAVDRALYETQDLIDEHDLPLCITFSASGYHRTDRRSWIGFLDGISNIPRGKRLGVIQDPLYHGLTYMTFLQIKVDLERWRSKLTLTEQEAVVGRRKDTGNPLRVASCRNGALRVETVAVPDRVGKFPKLSLFDKKTLPGGEGLTGSTHVRRAHRTRSGQRFDTRIFRQGYEYAAWNPRRKKLDVGLCFVSFQQTPGIFKTVADADTWLGSCNFGGGDTHGTGAGLGCLPKLEFLSVIGGGHYVVPPAADFPTIPGQAWLQLP